MKENNEKTMNEIDWDKPLECEHGLVVKQKKLLSSYMEVSCENSTWVVDDKTGAPLDSWMPKVYNAKRKPKEGEWWKVFVNCEMVLWYDGADWWTSPDTNRREGWM